MENGELQEQMRFAHLIEMRPQAVFSLAFASGERVLEFSILHFQLSIRIALI